MSNGIPKEPDQLESTLENHILNCPILQDIMEDPVMAADGHTYERAAIEGWIETKGARATSPMTGEPLTDLNVKSNHLVKSMIKLFAETAPARKLKELTASDLSLAIKLREEELEGILAKQSQQIDKAETDLKHAGARYETMKKRLSQAGEKKVPEEKIRLEDRELQDHLNGLVRTAQKQDASKLSQHLAANVLKRWFSQILASKKLKEQPYCHERKEALSSSLSEVRTSHESKISSQNPKQSQAMRSLEEAHKSALNEIRASIAKANENEDDDAIDSLTGQRSQLKKLHEEKKAALLKKGEKAIAEEQKRFEEEIGSIETKLQAVQAEKSQKVGHLRRYAERIKKQTQIINEQKESQIEERCELRRLSQGLCDYTKEGQRVRLFKPPAPALDEAELNQFLNYVAKGDQDEAEAMLKKTPALVLGKGICADHAGRIFKEITGFQYALWALDWHMWKMILPFFEELPEGKSEAREQCESQERLTAGLGHGSRYKMENLVNALKAYVDQYDELANVSSWNELRQLLVEGIGGAQGQTVAHVAQEYSMRRPFYPCPTWTITDIQRGPQGGGWPFGGVARGPVIFYWRGSQGGEIHQWSCEGWVQYRGDGRGFIKMDFRAIESLCIVRTSQLNETQSQLARHPRMSPR